MLSHSIKKPSITTRFQDELEKRRAARSAGVPYSQAALLSPPRQTTSEVMPWTKARFSNFADGIKILHPVGSYVTLKNTLAVPNTLPRWTFKVLYISELYNDTHFDTVTQEPVLLHLEPVDGGGIIRKCAGHVRALTEEEMKLVNLSNTKAEGSVQ